MKQNELAPPPGAKHRAKRVGRGLGSGRGRLSGRGGRGQGSRENVRPGFEGGQLPLYRRVSKRRGFRPPFRVEYAIVNLSQLDAFPADSVVTPETLLRRGLVKSMATPVKVLGEGEIARALTVRAHKFSASAREKLEKAGGKAEVLVEESAS